MGWIKDILGPSNLWSVFQFCFPAAAAAVSGWLSTLWNLPPSVTILVAVATGACAIILADAFRPWFDRRNSQIQKIAELEERLRPKIKLVATSCPITNFDRFERTITIEIENDSGDILDNCLAQITRMGAFRSFGPENEISEIGPEIFEVFLPITLKTEKNFKRSGGAPFQLRAKQRKKLPLCTRCDGEKSGLCFVNEDGESWTVDSATSCDFEISVFGAPSPTIIRIHMEIDGNGEPVVTHHV